MIPKTKKTRGFTLIELLVVIAIIALLASIILTSLGRSQQKARDARRVSDIKEIQLALSLYYNDNNTYPSDIYVTSGTCGGASQPPCLSPNYISVVPKDPSNNTDYTYVALTTTSGSSDCDSYHLAAGLETDADVPSDNLGKDEIPSSEFFQCGSGSLPSWPSPPTYYPFDVMP